MAIQKTLGRKFSEARSVNPAFSLRAFSRKLGMSSSAVSEIMNGKRMVSKKMAERIAQRLSLDPLEVDEVLSLFPPKRSGPRPMVARETKRSLRLSADQFKAISEWYHFAILSLLETEGARSEIPWIAQRLRISQRDCAQAIDRLVRMGLLNRDGERLALTGRNFTTTDEVSSLALRKTHAENLELGKRSLEIDDISLRDFTAMTMAIDPARLSEAKKMIRNFRDRLSEFMESGRKAEVYKICVQLIPLTEQKPGALPGALKESTL